jgi:hypothetical protein
VLPSLLASCGGDKAILGGVVPDAGGNHPAADTSSGTGPDSTVDPFAQVKAAESIATMAFSRAVATTVQAGDNVIALFANNGLALVDLADPTNPVRTCGRHRWQGCRRGIRRSARPGVLCR